MPEQLHLEITINGIQMMSVESWTKCDKCDHRARIDPPNPGQEYRPYCNCEYALARREFEK